MAAAHPDLTVAAAHFGWPWHMDLPAGVMSAVLHDNAARILS